MEYTQKKGKNIHTFTMEGDFFNFAYQDKSGSGDSDFRYADVPKKTSVVIEQNDWLRNVGLLWCALAVLQIGYALYNGQVRGSIWLVLGLGCIAVAHFKKVKYTVLKMDGGNVFVIQDKQHDVILDELEIRRKDQLLRWFGDVNPENDREEEIKKFQWLCDEEVISREDAEKKIAQIALLNDEAPATNESGLN